jgi:hypothetical protein
MVNDRVESIDKKLVTKSEGRKILINYEQIRRVIEIA